MSVILTGPSPLVPRPEEEGARTAGAHFTDGETEAHSSMPKFTLQAAEGVGTHPGVHPECSARVWRPRSGALPTTVPLSASLRCRGGALPLHERAFSRPPVSASVPGSLQGTCHIGGHGVGDGEEMTPKGNTKHVEKDLLFKNSPSCLSSRAGVSHLPLASASRGAAPAVPSLPSSPSARSPAEGPQGPRLWAPVLAGGGRAQRPQRGDCGALRASLPPSPAAVLWASPRSASSRRACWGRREASPDGQRNQGATGEDSGPRGLWGAEGQRCERPCAGGELAPGPSSPCGVWRVARVGGRELQLAERAAALEVMGASVCPPVECSTWVSGQLALGSLGDLGVGSPCPRPPSPSLGLSETQAASLHPQGERRCLFPETLSVGG